MKLSEVYTKAASLIEKRGWTQREYRSKDGRYCTVGAIRRTIRGDANLDGSEAYEACKKLRNLLNMPLIFWNDHPNQTAEHVVACLREAAKRV